MAAPRHRGRLRYASPAGPRHARSAALAAGLLGVLIAVIALSPEATEPERPSAVPAPVGDAPPSPPTAATPDARAQLDLEVVDTEGTPVPGAALFVDGRRVATGDDRGRLRDLSASLQGVEVRAEGFEPLLLPELRTLTRVVLERSNRTVRVVDSEGRSVPYADLVLDDGTERQAHRADVSGKLGIPARFAGQLTAYDAGIGAGTRAVGPGQGEVVVALASDAGFDVEVRDSSGAPAVGAAVWWRALGVPPDCQPPPSTALRTDARGRTPLRGPTLPGEVCAELRPGLRGCSPSGALRVRLSLSPVVCVEVVVVDGRDRAPQRGVARVTGPGGYMRGLAVPGVLDDAPAGAELDLEVDVPGFGVLREQRPAAARVELALPVPAQVSVLFEGPSAAFPARLSMSGPERREAEVLAPGVLALQGLAPGPYSLVVSAPAGSPLPVEMTLGPGEHRTLPPIRLSGGGALEVRGSGWVSLRVEATGALARVADLGSGGVERFTDLPEGWMTVLARTERGWEQVSRTWVDPGAEAAVLDLDHGSVP